MKIRHGLGRFLKDSVVLNTLYNTYYKTVNHKQFFLIQEERKEMSIFNYEDLSAPIPYYPLEFVKDSNFYGQNYWIKQYAGLDKIDISIEHGLYYGDYIPYSSYCKTVHKIATLSLVRKQILERLGKPVITLGPYIHYAPCLLKEQEVVDIKRKLGKTLLFFPMHTTSEGGHTFNIDETVKIVEKFAENLRFDTILVCMYYYDILNSNHAQSYEKAGFKVVTAGHRLDLNFLPRLKLIISLADYTMANSVGTQTGYCIYLNKPHYIICPKVFSMMPDDFKEITNVFHVYSNNITVEQHNVVSKYWGFNQIKTPESLRLLLYS